MGKCGRCYHQKDGITCSVRDGIECCIDGTWRSFKPKQEDNVEKRCSTCDRAGVRKWTDGHCCKVYSDCHTLDYLYWKLRRDYNQENKEQETQHCDYCGAKLERGYCITLQCMKYGEAFPQTKEQEMSYKPTSKMTIRNIAKKIKETGCKDASMKFVEYLCIVGDPNEGTIRVDKKLDKLSRLFTHLTKTNESTEWAIHHSFIEEEISLKPCPHCGETKYAGIVSAREMHDNDEYEYGDDYAMCCNHIKGGCGLRFGYEPSKQEAIKAWNTRKQ